MKERLFEFTSYSLRNFCLFGALFLCLKLFAAEKIAVVITADNGYPPYSYSDKSNPSGIYYEILKKIFENFDEKYSIEIKLLPWTQAVEEVKNGNAFAVYPPYKSLKTRPWMLYSEPLLQESISVFCQNPVKRWPQDYVKAKVGINFGFAFPPFIFKIFRDSQMRVYAFDSNEEALKNFNSKEIDCYVNDRQAVLFTNHLLSLPPINEVASLGQENSYLGFSSEFVSKYKFQNDFMENFNTRLQTMKKNGTLDSIVNNFLSKSK